MTTRPDVVAQPAQDPADEVRAAVLAVPGVVDLHPGRYGEVATLLPGRRVAGVRLAEPGRPDGRSEVHLVVDTSAPVTRTADAVHTALARLGHTGVHIVVGDVRDPGERAPGDPAGT